MQPKTAFPLVHGADLKGQLRVDFVEEPDLERSRQALAGGCLEASFGRCAS
jgi:hypothetical protein